MSDKQMMIIASPVHRERALQMVRHAPDGFIVEVKPKTRSLEQNRMLWACLDDVAKQVDREVEHGDCVKIEKLNRDEWKDYFTAILKKSKFVRGEDGISWIAVGAKTSTMNKREFSDLINLIHAFGANNGVQWSDSANEVYAQWMNIDKPNNQLTDETNVIDFDFVEVD